MIASITDDAELMNAAGTLATRVIDLPGEFPVFTNMSRLALALGAVQRSDPSEAIELYTALQNVPGIMLLYVNTDRVLGLLSRTLGRLDQAVEHLEAALTFCTRADYKPEYAWVCRDYAETLLQRGSPGDHKTAIGLLEECLSISRDLEMKSLFQRVQDRMKEIQGVPGVYPDRLSAREVQVLRLIAAGQSNNEIAEELALSVRTVERHITSIYTKANVHHRAEAISYAFTHDLRH